MMASTGISHRITSCQGPSTRTLMAIPFEHLEQEASSGLGAGDPGNRGEEGGSARKSSSAGSGAGAGEGAAARSAHHGQQIFFVAAVELGHHLGIR